VIAVVLAGGRGTRLGVDVPKPLVPIAGVPVIDRILDALAGDAVGDVVVVTGHRAEEVEGHLSGTAVRFARQQEPLGTADALLAARDAVGHAPFLVTWADVVVEPGTYRRVAEAAGDHDGAVAINPLDDLSSGGSVKVENGLVSSIVEKPGPVAGWNLTGVLALRSTVWPHLEAVERSVRGEYELPDAINAWIEDGARIGSVPIDGPVFEVGTPHGVAAATAYFSGNSPLR